MRARADDLISALINKWRIVLSTFRLRMPAIFK